jgi:hypothetical protein
MIWSSHGCRIPWGKDHEANEPVLDEDVVPEPVSRVAVLQA